MDTEKQKFGTYKTPVADFANLVERDYGADIAAKFLKRFVGVEETEFSTAMEVLDEVLLDGRKPVFPIMGKPTNSPASCRGEFKFAK